MFQLYFAEVGNPKECLDPGFEWGGEDVRMGGTFFFIFLHLWDSFLYMFICETSCSYHFKCVTSTLMVMTNMTINGDDVVDDDDVDDDDDDAFRPVYDQVERNSRRLT